MDCTCPNPNTSLVTIVALACGVDLKQIQRLGFQRSGDSFNTAAGTPTNILELADWQAKLTATDDTKIVVTPLIGGDPIIEAGDAITNGGGDNTTLNGVTETTGKNPSSFSCVFKSLPSEIERQISELFCEPSLRVYFFLQGGFIACVEIVTSVEYTGFDIQAFFFSDRNNAGFGTKDTHSMSFELPANWSKNLVKLKPNFNPLTDL